MKESRPQSGAGSVCRVLNRVGCPKFGHIALTSNIFLDSKSLFARKIFLNKCQLRFFPCQNFLFSKTNTFT